MANFLASSLNQSSPLHSHYDCFDCYFTTTPTALALNSCSVATSGFESEIVAMSRHLSIPPSVSVEIGLYGRLIKEKRNVNNFLLDLLIAPRTRTSSATGTCCGLVGVAPRWHQSESGVGPILRHVN